VKNGIGKAIALVVVALAGFIYTLVAGNEPLLGLDLQGGVSVVLQPTRDASDEELTQTVEIVRSRVDALGVAEPEISLQGDTIVVDLPGVEQQQRALELVGQTAELRFREVIFDLGPSLEFAPQIDPDATPSEDEESMAPIRRNRQTTEEDPDGTTEDPDVTTTVPAAPADTLSPSDLAITEACDIAGITPPEQDLATSYVVLADENGSRLCLSPSRFTGEVVDSAQATIAGAVGNQWQVSLTLKSGNEGINQWNQVAAECFGRTGDCSTGRLAIVLDGQVVSAPTIQTPNFDRSNISITGNFSEDEARNLGLVLRYGSLPVELETLQLRTVSATIGDDVLRAGIFSGIVGLVMVTIFLLAYYRLAGLVAIVGLMISGLLLWTVIAWFGENAGLAITLAGIVGLIVSVGVSADSNIVYFENVKDSVASGRRISTAVERAYLNSISTIVKADVVSLIAAVLLYFLTVGAVRGFAFYLGLATLLDLLVAYLFMKPALTWLGELDAVKANPRLLGLPLVEQIIGKKGGSK
jgi:preprotein translocase subunit SecD